jgi:hypothetical protein
MRSLNPFLSVVIAVLLIRCLAVQSAEPEDPQVRARAISLLEHAVQLSSPVWPMNEESFTFHILNPEPGAATTGSIKIRVAAPDLKRWDYTYGAYQYSRVQDGKEFATYRTGPEPVGLTMVRKLIPVNLVRFDQSDLIRAISDQSMDGTPAICVDFDTIAGTRHQSGALCFDKAAGYLIYEKIDDVVTKQSKFYRFNNGFLPGHIERWTNGAKLVEIESKIEVRSAGFPMENFGYPVGATVTHACNSFTPAYADYTVRPVAKQYYQPTSQQRDFTVHFQGWQ